MSTSVTTPRRPGNMSESSYQNKLRLNRIYHKNRYDTDIAYRQREIERNAQRIKQAYHTDPEVRERMKKNALERYYRIKAENELLSRRIEKK